MSDLLTYFKDQKQPMVDFLTTLVNYETPTTDKAAVDKLGAFMEAQFNQLGASVTRIPQEKVGRFPAGEMERKRPR